MIQDEGYTQRTIDEIVVYPRKINGAQAPQYLSGDPATPSEPEIEVKKRIKNVPPTHFEIAVHDYIMVGKEKNVVL